MGATALVVTPYYNKPTPMGLIKHFVAIRMVDTPIVVYNIKRRTNQHRNADNEIAKIPSVVAVKEASGDINQMQEVLTQIPKLTV